MHKYTYLLLLYGSLLAVSCQRDPNPLVLTPIPPVTPAPPSPTLIDFTVPDSINIYRPLFGNVATARQLPFGSATQPVSKVRLISVMNNGKLACIYQYDNEGRLSERINYYTDGTHISQKINYSLKAGSIATLSILLNKEAPYVEGYPRGNELITSSTINYVSDTASWVKRNSQTDFALYSFELGSSVSRLGFSSSGALIWEEKLNEQGKAESYSLYRRNEVGNIVFHRNGSLMNRWTADYYTYDDKPNPSRTTGDIQSMSINGYAFETTNTNNVLMWRSINSSGGQDLWRCEYTYRPDGYPSQVKQYRNNAPASIIEFTYNQ